MAEQGQDPEENVARAIEDCIQGFIVEDVVFEGAGDFCRAYTVNGRWIFRFAHNREGSVAVERESLLLPRLAAAVTLPVPAINYVGRHGEAGFADRKSVV